MALKELIELREPENRLFLILISWLLIAISSLDLFNVARFPIVGVIIFIPFLEFTLFLIIVSLFKKDIKEYSRNSIIGLFVASFLLMPIILIILAILFVFSVFSYLIITSSFMLYACYKGGYTRDREIYINKKHIGFWMGLEFFGGITLSILLLVGFIFATFELGAFVPLSGFDLFEPNLVIFWTYMVVIIIVAFLSVIAILYAIKHKINAWMGLYFILISIYSFYLIFKMMRIQSQSSSWYMMILSLLLDIGVILYSVSGLLGSKSEVLHQKLKIKQGTIFLWLLFSKAAYEFAINFPYQELLGEPENDILLYIVNIGENLSMYTNIAVYLLFLIMIIFYGVYGMSKYGQRTEEWMEIRMGEKIVGEPIDIKEESILEAESIGERSADENKPIVYTSSIIEEEEEEEEDKPAVYTSESEEKEENNSEEEKLEFDD